MDQKKNILFVVFLLKILRMFPMFQYTSVSGTTWERVHRFIYIKKKKCYILLEERDAKLPTPIVIYHHTVSIFNNKKKRYVHTYTCGIHLYILKRFDSIFSRTLHKQKN